MRQIFQYKSKHVLYNTWRVEETDEEKAEHEAAAAATANEEAAADTDNAEVRAKKNAEEANLTDDQLNVVLASMSDNRISDNVAALVEQNS